MQRCFLKMMISYAFIFSGNQFITVFRFLGKNKLPVIIIPLKVLAGIYAAIHNSHFSNIVDILINLKVLQIYNLIN